MKPDLQTTYMGLQLPSPLVVSASPLTQDVDNIVRMEAAGAGAVVLFSLFEEQINAEVQSVQRFWEPGVNNPEEAPSDLPGLDTYPVGVSQYLKLIREASSRCSIPIIGSLNGITPEGWTDYAKEIEAAGAQGLELNIFYIPADLSVDGRAVEAQYLEVLKQVKASIKHPCVGKAEPLF